MMLSKLDEAIHSWPLIQALCEHSLPLLFASRGPAIDEPIDAPDTEALVDMALRSLPLSPVPAHVPGERIAFGNAAPDVWRSARNV